MTKVVTYRMNDNTSWREAWSETRREIWRLFWSVTSCMSVILHIQGMIFRQPTEEALGLRCRKCKAINQPDFVLNVRLSWLGKYKTVKFEPLLISSDNTFCLHNCIFG